MGFMKGWRALLLTATVSIAAVASAGAADRPFVWAGAPLPTASAPESERLARAKDLIADEQWVRAVAELRAAAADPKETSPDEVLYWLAHSLNQSGDSAAALETIQRLEQRHPASLWVKPARSLRLDIAVHLRRDDVLWWMAVAPRAPGPDAPTPPAWPRRPGRSAAPPPPPVPPPPAPAAPVAAAPPAPPLPPPPPSFWLPENFRPDTDLRIQALGSLIADHPARVIPFLREIALDKTDDGEARRAVFVLAQSGQAEAEATVVHVAKVAAPPVRLAAVRELGRFGGPDAARELLQVYTTGDAAVKQQVVMTLGERSDRGALVRIVQSESDEVLRHGAIVALGQAGGREQLRALYARADRGGKASIILGLFNARADEDLIAIAAEERDPALREAAIKRLRLMGTPRAKAWLLKAGAIR